MSYWDITPLDPVAAKLAAHLRQIAHEKDAADAEFLRTGKRVNDPAITNEHERIAAAIVQAINTIVSAKK